MKATELQIGDFVYAGIYLRDPSHIPEITQIPVKVIGIGNNVVVEYIFENTIKNHIFPLEMLIPIQLTAEILEKNGWKKLPSGTIYHWDRINKSKDIVCDDELSFSFLGHTFKLIYVHELQRALRLCGLNDLADSIII